jgi:hypothetical protein
MLLTTIGWGRGFNIHPMIIFFKLLNIVDGNDFLNKNLKNILVPSSYFHLLLQLHYPSLSNEIQI